MSVHLIRDFVPDQRNGPIFTSVDWGGTNPHAVNWYQLLRHEIEVETWVQPAEGQQKRYTTRLKEGTLVAFDEIYIAEIGNEKLGTMVHEHEFRWRQKLGTGWFVFQRFADPQGKAARMDWKAMGLKTSWHTTREFDEHIKAIKAMFDDDLFRADGEKCPKFAWEIKQWRIDERTGNQLDERNHCMSNFRYAVANIKKIRRKVMVGGGTPGKARTIPRQTTIVQRPTGTLPVQIANSKSAFDRWRSSLGEPMTRNEQ